MSRCKGPRLYLRKDENHPRWVIRDGSKMVGTGCREDERAGAEAALQRYIEKTGLEKRDRLLLYFVSAHYPAFPVKIGITKRENTRFSALQTSLPYPVNVMCLCEIDDPSIEGDMHRRYRHIHLRGEWFERTAELLSFIEELNAAVNKDVLWREQHKMTADADTTDIPIIRVEATP